MGAMADLAGEDNLIWASDFPHSDAKYPGVVDELHRARRATCLTARQRKIVGANAARIYAHRGPLRRSASRRCLSSISWCGAARSSTVPVCPRSPPTSACGTAGSLPSVDSARQPRRRTIDADGCVVAPGFVDIHTHYDAQLHFEPTASPSSWHGVTTVINGNCGFSLFPARPADVTWLCEMLSRVEGMSADDPGGGGDLPRWWSA